MGSILYTIANWRKLVLSSSLTILLKIYLYYISVFRNQTLGTYKYLIRQTKILRLMHFRVWFYGQKDQIWIDHKYVYNLKSHEISSWNTFRNLQQITDLAFSTKNHMSITRILTL